MKDHVEILLEKAEQDLKAVENLLKSSDSPTEIMAFHIQQMVEKLLKALLVYYNIDFKPTHDLFFLIEKLENKDETFQEFYSFAEDLSPFAVLVRYEEGFDLELDEVELLLKQAYSLREKTIGIIGLRRGRH